MIKQRIKQALFRSGPKPRSIHFGPSKGIFLLLDRRSDLMREMGLHETELHSFYRDTIVPRAVVYDIGAADGDTSLMFARLGGNVVAFEPDPDLAPRIQANLALNPDIAGRVRIMTMYVGPEEVPAESQPDWAHRVPTRPLDALVRQGEIPPPDVVKIDVDGGEGVVLQGMRGVLTNLAPPVMVETHSAALEGECLTLLQAAGYRTEIVNPARWRRLVPEHRPTAHNRWLIATRPGGPRAPSA